MQAGGRKGHDSRMLWIVVLLLLGLCAACLAWLPLLRIDSPASINYNEGWNAYRQSMASQGRPLYGSPPGLWVTNYPPLSFHIIGWLGASIGNMVLAGRLVAFAGLAGTAALAGATVRAASGSMRGGVYAGLCLFVWIATSTPERRAANDPELLAAAIASFGLFAYVRAPRSLGWPVLSALSFAVALFTKQDLLALPLSVGIHLLLTRNWRAFAAWAAAGLLAAILLLELTIRLDGRHMLANLLQPRAYLAHNLGVNALGYVSHFGVTLAIGLAMLAWQRTMAFRGLLLVLLVTTHLASLFFAGGDGVAPNIFYPCLIADAVCYACAIGSWPGASWRSPRKPWMFAAALVVPCLLTVVFVPFRVGRDVAAALRLPADASAAEAAVAVLHSVHGPVVCEDILLCHQAGKALDFDPYFVNDQLLIGRLSQARILGMLAAHHYAAIEVGDGVDKVPPTATGRRRFNKAFMRTLWSDYKPIYADGVHTIFVPRD